MQEEPELRDWLNKPNDAQQGEQQPNWRAPAHSPEPPTGWQTAPQARKRHLWAGAGLVAAGLVAGGVLAGAVTASAASGTSSAAASGYSATSPSGAGTERMAPNFPAHGSAAHEDAEKPVTGTNAAKAQAAAVRAIGSGKAGAVTTDFQGSGYEVDVTKADGSTVEVHLDPSFNVVDHGGPPRG